MGRRGEQYARIWRRDEGRCGIHLQGCGAVIKKGEGNVGHIIPKTMINRGHFDEYMSRAERKAVEAKLGKRIARDMNVQPMHKECNEGMKSVFPPARIRCLCTCCTWMYEENVEGIWRPILGLSPEEEREGIPEGRDGEDYRISRWFTPTGGGTRICMSRLFAWRVQVHGPEGPVSHPVLVMTGRHKGQGLTAGKSVGNLGITLRQMHRHNMQTAMDKGVPMEQGFQTVASISKDFRK